jgi:hypothetical protein
MINAVLDSIYHEDNKNEWLYNSWCFNSLY